MSTGQTWQTVSTSSDETLALAEQIGRRLRGGEVIELISDLGGGKTTFVKGLAKGMGSHDRISSPSFTICNQYSSDKLTLYHFDFYRLNEAGVMKDELTEVLDDPKVVIVIEWGALVEDVLPIEKVTLRLQVTADNKRQIITGYPAKLGYLFQ